MVEDLHVVIVIGASRGIGREIAITLAQNGFTVIVSAKSTSSTTKSLRQGDFPPDPNSSDSTIHTVTEEIRVLGYKADAIPVDVRSPSSINSLIKSALQMYTHIDAIIYNAGAVYWAPLADTPLAKYELMHEVNSRGLYCCVQSILPHFFEKNQGRLVVVSPPIYRRFTRGKAAYSMTKFAMTALMMGLAADFKRKEGFNGGVCSIWPATSILSAATEFVAPKEHRELRQPKIFADAILAILQASDFGNINGQAWLDEDYLRVLKGLANYQKYNVTPGLGREVMRTMPKKLPDLTVEEEDVESSNANSLEIERRRKRDRAKI